MAAAQDTSKQGHQPRLTHSGLINQVPSLQCPICYNFMTEPKVLSCEHTFCLTCLSKIVRKDKITCALCRHVTKITDGNAATLPSNLAFQSVVEEVANLEGRCDVCDNIDKPDKISYCQDCIIFMCPDCLEKHDGKTENNNHSVNKTRRSKHFSALKRRDKFCSLHEKLTCERICVKCNIYVCKECSVIHENEGHEVQDLVKWATTLHATATPLTNDIQLLKRESNSWVQNCKYYEDKTVQHIDSVMSQINYEYQASLKKLEKNRLSKIKSCSDLKLRTCKVSGDLIDQIEKCNSLLDQTNHLIQCVLDSPFGDMPANNSTLESIQSKISGLKNDVKRITEKSANMLDVFKDADTLNLQKKCEDYDVVKLIRHVWERTSRPLTQPDKKMACMTLDCEDKVVVGYFQGGIEVFTKTGSKGVIVESLKEERVMAMSFGNDGQLVLRNMHNDIIIYGRTFKRRGIKFETIDHKKGGDGDLALDKNNDIYASYRIIKVIHMYRKQGGKALREIKCGGFIPQQILVMSNTDIIVMDAATIRVLDKSGASKSKIARKGYLGYPAVALDGTLIIAWVKPGGRYVEIVEYTKDMKFKKALLFDNNIDLSGRQWFYCRIVDAETIAFCCPKEVHLFCLHIKPFSSQSHEDGHLDMNFN